MKKAASIYLNLVFMIIFSSASGQLLNADKKPDFFSKTEQAATTHSGYLQ